MEERDRRSKPGPCGFTLLELIVALAILAMIAGSVTVGLRAALASIERGEGVAREAARLRAAVGIIERAIRSADPMRFPAGDNTIAFFVGEEKRLRFLTAQGPAAIHGGGFRLVSFFETPGPAGGLAITTAAPFLPEGPWGWEGGESPRILIAEAAEVSFTYSEGPTEEGMWEWVSSWDSKETGRLPAAVRVEYAVPAEEGARKTAFVVPIPAGERVAR